MDRRVRQPGKRTTGTAAQDFVVAPPGYRGQPPEGLPAITAPTPYVWIIGRTQTNGPADYSAVHNVQAGYSITVTGQAPEHTNDPDQNEQASNLTNIHTR